MLVTTKQGKAKDAKMLALFDKLSPETQQQLLHADPGLSLGEAAASVESNIRSGKAPDVMRSRTQMLWNAQKTAPYNPMQHMGEAAKVNKMISMWNTKADTNPAGSYSDY